MTSREIDALWVEVTRMKAELERLSTQREVLISHLDQIRELGGDLTASKAKVEEMAAEVEQLLGGTHGPT